MVNSFLESADYKDFRDGIIEIMTEVEEIVSHFATGNVIVYVTLEGTLAQEPPEPTEYIAVKAMLSFAEYNELQGYVFALDRKSADINLQVPAFLNREMQIAFVSWRLYDDDQLVPFDVAMIGKLNANDELPNLALEEFARLNPILARRARAR